MYIMVQRQYATIIYIGDTAKLESGLLIDSLLIGLAYWPNAACAHVICHFHYHATYAHTSFIYAP